jgi:hypothetical protein
LVSCPLFVAFAVKGDQVCSLRVDKKGLGGDWQVPLNRGPKVQVVKVIVVVAGCTDPSHSIGLY